MNKKVWHWLMAEFSVALVDGRIWCGIGEWQG